MARTIDHIEESDVNIHDVQDRLTEAAATPGRKPSFMERLSTADRQALRARARQQRIAATTIICQEGSPGDSLYVVQAGKVAVLKEVSDGRSILLGYRGPGEVLGEMSLLGQQPRSASVIAVEDTDLLTISAADFPTLIDNYPGINWAILNVLNDRLHAADTARTAVVQTGRNLERRVRRLTTEAERQADLARARQEALELIAHDLRTPLTVIDGCLQILRSTLPPATLASSGDVLDLAVYSTKRLSSLLQTLLEAARQDELGVSLNLQSVNLVDLVKSAEESLQPTAASSGISLGLEIAPDFPRPVGDVEKLERVVLNLLENALGYTPDGGSVVVVGKARSEEIEISVIDTGPGIPPEYRETVFERFVRVPGVTGRQKGFGLGLYYCRQVIKAHHGRIWMEPGPGGIGSRFVLVLPVEGQQP
jgi:signal transduction histidine kinase